ncbi:MAG: hypothetical protein U1F64_10805 [Burkholderiales bacterium]
MGTKRANFTDAQKAQIYVRDRALCSYSGKSLWLLDYGAAPALTDHVDHVVPASKGGDAGLENGVLCTFLHNYVRRDRHPPVRLFNYGLPTLDAFWIFDRIPAQILHHIDRFAVLRPSDWYFNRAIAQLRWASAQTDAPKRKDGRHFARGVEYYCRAAVRQLRKWRELASAEKGGDLASRGLLPEHPRPDHQMVLLMQTAATEKEVESISRELAPYHEASFAAVEALADVETELEFPRHSGHFR